MIRPIILSLFTLLVTFACKNPEQLANETTPEPAPNQERTVMKGQLVMDFSQHAGSSPTGIQYAEVNGNEMSIRVKYSGGCQQHEFKLLGHKMISKSNPPLRNIKLFHNANNDDCREIIEEVIVFDISAFGYNDQEITLLLNGYGERIAYKPVN